MAAALPIAMVAGGGLSAYGALQKGQMTAQTLQAQAVLNQGNAQEAVNAGQYNATRETLLANQKMGAEIAGYGASGVDVNSGSAAAVLAASATNAELDRLNIIHQSEVKAINYNNQASLDQYGAESAIQGSKWEAIGDLFSSLTKAASAAGGGGA